MATARFHTLLTIACQVSKEGNKTVISPKLNCSWTPGAFVLRPSSLRFLEDVLSSRNPSIGVKRLPRASAYLNITRRGAVNNLINSNTHPKNLRVRGFAEAHARVATLRT